MQRWKKTAAVTLLMSGTMFLLFARESYGITAGTFSDPAFYESVRIYDRNGDGLLTPEERAEVVVLNVSGKGIASLEGIEAFPELRELYCYDNALDSLDVSRNSKLQILDCTNNRLTVLDLIANQELGQLYCRDNPLSEIVLTNGQSLAALEHDEGVPVDNGQGETGETGETGESNSEDGNSSGNGNGSSDEENEISESGSSTGWEKAGEQLQFRRLLRNRQGFFCGRCSGDC